jgi:hypothetical protein
MLKDGGSGSLELELVHGERSNGFTSSLSLWMRAYSKSSMTRFNAMSSSSSSGPGFTTKTG